MTHTKGPWSIDGDTIRAVNGLDVGVVYRSNGANGKLIAAAPELLEAAKEIRAWFDADGHANSVPPRVLVDYLSGAIAKAEGDD